MNSTLHCTTCCMMKWLVLVFLIFTVSQIQAYPPRGDDESDMADNNDAQLMEAELFAYTELLKRMQSPSQHPESQNPHLQLPIDEMDSHDVAAQTQYPDSPNNPSPSNRAPFDLLSLLKNIEHMEGEDIEDDGIQFVQQMPDEIADHQTNALCTDPKQCSCQRKSQLGSTVMTKNGAPFADCFIVGIPYCEGPCHGVFRYVFAV